ncbi:MAG: SDR family oxidoreductase [Gemmatimonadales bacterium]
MTDHRAVLILGATGGIGSALARRLAGDGVRLGLAARNGAALDALGATLGGAPLVLDAREPEAVERAARSVLERFGRLDGVVNCVGSLLLKPAHLTSVDDWDHTMSLNLRTAFGAVRAAALVMPGPGAVVLLSSAAARTGLANHEAISAAKAGVLGLTLSAAASYAPKGIRVNAVAPGLVRTPLTAQLIGTDALAKASAALHPLGRIGEPEEIAAAIAWLLSDEAAWVTGQVLGVDGGLGTVRGRR